jgi:hypothetical protein
MEEQLEEYLKEYRGLIVPHKLYRLAVKNPKDASYYLTQACEYAKKNNYVGIYEDTYALQKKTSAFPNLQLPAHDDDWANATHAMYKEESQKKESDIVRAVSNQMREGIRVLLHLTLALLNRSWEYRYEVRVPNSSIKALC